ncbi:MAG: FixH family protein [Methylococcales bacterium]|nr:FixH family protein [Methylococcales bacterium]
MKKVIMGALLTALVFTSCKKEDTTPDTTPGTPATTQIEIATETTANNEVVTLFSDQTSLTNGYENLYVTIKDASGNAMNSATVEYKPMMDMGMMQHSCPTEQPTFNSSLGKYKGAAVFVMSSMAGTWTLEVKVNGASVTFPITVAEAPTKVMGMYTGTDGASYVVSLLRPTTWSVGMNDVEFLLHKRVSGMDWPAVTDFTMVMMPWMTSMNHGSANNIDPVHVGSGHYNGEVNYTMTGDWRLHLQLNQNGTEIHDDAFLDILF